MTEAVIQHTPIEEIQAFGPRQRNAESSVRNGQNMDITVRSATVTCNPGTEVFHLITVTDQCAGERISSARHYGGPQITLPQMSNDRAFSIGVHHPLLRGV